MKLPGSWSFTILGCSTKVGPIGSVGINILPPLSDCPTFGILTMLPQGHPLRHPRGEKGERLPESSIGRSKNLFLRPEAQLSNFYSGTVLIQSQRTGDAHSLAFLLPKQPHPEWLESCNRVQGSLILQGGLHQDHHRQRRLRSTTAESR